MDVQELSELLEWRKNQERSGFAVLTSSWTQTENKQEATFLTSMGSLRLAQSQTIEI